jgi:hypothetical protein
MSLMLLVGRPWVVFDPANRQHRQAYYQFQETKSWGKCEVRFILPSDEGDLVSMITRQLIEYYTKKEFGKSKKKVLTQKAK